VPPHGVGPCAIERRWTGRIRRSPAVVRQFKRLTGHPRGRPGYQVDHIWPLKRGGCDCVSNLQWLTLEAKRAKDKTE
jgi:hypothetical protein